MPKSRGLKVNPSFYYGQWLGSIVRYQLAAAAYNFAFTAIQTIISHHGLHFQQHQYYCPNYGLIATILLALSWSLYQQVLRPFTFYHFPVLFVVAALSLCSIFHEKADEFLAICEKECSFSLFFIMFELSFVTHPIRINAGKIHIVNGGVMIEGSVFIVELPCTLECEVTPMAFIGYLSIIVVHLSEAINGVIFPLAFIVTSIQVNELSHAVSFVIHFKTLEFSFIGLFYHKNCPRIWREAVQRFDLSVQRLFFGIDHLLIRIGKRSIRKLNGPKFGFRKLGIRFVVKLNVLHQRLIVLIFVWTLVVFNENFGFFRRLRDNSFYFSHVEAAQWFIRIPNCFLSQVQQLQIRSVAFLVFLTRVFQISIQFPTLSFLLLASLSSFFLVWLWQCLDLFCLHYGFSSQFSAVRHCFSKRERIFQLNVLRNVGVELCQFFVLLDLSKTRRRLTQIS